MKRLISLVLVSTLTLGLQAQLKPYVEAFRTDAPPTSVAQSIKDAAQANGLKVVGQYSPDTKIPRILIVVTSDELINAVKKTGGLRGFAATQRIAITQEGKSVVSFTNPAYWGNAYYQEDYPSVESLIKGYEQKVLATMKQVGEVTLTPFGSEKGVKIDDLRDYQYMFGMPEFDDTVELESFGSYQEAKGKVDANLKKDLPGVSLVYRLEIPGKEITLYGIGLSGPTGESQFMPIIDIGSPKHTAFLPYELLVVGDEVHILHGRFRIALSFPDLTMGTFSKIMSTPGDIEDLMEQLVE